MRKYLYGLIILCAALTLTLAACGIDGTTSLKELAKPYVTRYECTSATFGGEDILGRFDYIRVTVLDEEEMELAFKEKGKEGRARTFGYAYDEASGELTAEEWILGVKVKERTVIKDGAFTISLPLGGKELILKFEKM